MPRRRPTDDSSSEGVSQADDSLDTSAASSAGGVASPPTKPPPAQYVVFSQPDGSADLGNTGVPTQPQQGPPGHQPPYYNQQPYNYNTGPPAPGMYPPGSHVPPPGQGTHYVQYHVHPAPYPGSQYAYPQATNDQMLAAAAATMTPEELALLEEFAKLIRMSRTTKVLAVIAGIDSIFWFLTPEFWWAGFLVLFAPFGFVGAHRFKKTYLWVYLVYTVLYIALHILYLVLMWSDQNALFKILNILSVVVTVFIFFFIFQFAKAIPDEGMQRYAMFGVFE